MDHGVKPNFDELYRACEARVYGYCWRLCNGNEAEAQDLAQETFIRAFRGLDQFEGRSSVLTWLFQIARREWIRAHKKKEDTVPLETPGLQEPGHDPTTGQLRDLWVRTALQRLPEHLREALILVKSEGLTYREAAEILDLPQGTVQFHVHQALKQMRGLLADQLGLPAVLGVVFAFYLQRSLRAEVTTPTPAGMMAQIYGAIGRPIPAPLSGSVLPERRTAARPPVRTAVLALLAVVFVALSVPVLIGSLQKGSPPAASGPRARLSEALASLSRVRTAHAEGVSTKYFAAFRGPDVEQKSDVNYWYKLPNRYVFSQRFLGKEALRVVMEGSRGTSHVFRPNGDILLPLNSTVVALTQAPFAVFTRDGELPRLASQAQVTSLAADGGPIEGALVQAEVTGTDTRQRWLLHLGTEAARPVRVEYESDSLVGAGWKLRARVVLDNLEYDLPVLDSLFDLSRSE